MDERFIAVSPVTWSGIYAMIMFMMFVGGVRSNQSNFPGMGMHCKLLKMVQFLITFYVEIFNIYASKIIILLSMVYRVPEARFQSMESRQECEKIVHCIVIERTEVER